MVYRRRSGIVKRKQFLLATSLCCAIISLFSIYFLFLHNSQSKSEFSFLYEFRPKEYSSTVSIHLTGKFRSKHSFVFRKGISKLVLNAMRENCNPSNDWAIHDIISGEYVEFSRQAEYVSFYTWKGYRTIDWPHGSQILPIDTGGCAVEILESDQSTVERIRTLSARKISEL